MKAKMSKLPQLSLHLGEHEILPSSSVRNLGIVFDSCLSMDDHITSVIRSCSMHMRNISRIRQYLTLDATKSLIHALVTSRLDYGNALLYGIADCQLHRLQLIQNSAARLITKSSKRDHITPILFKLHWLPVHCRIRYKILLYAFKTLCGLGPEYLNTMIKRYQPTRYLRSEGQNLLQIPNKSNRSARSGDRAFSVVAPKLWNSLPVHLRETSTISSFKKLLKTYLFRSEYSALI